MTKAYYKSLYGFKIQKYLCFSFESYNTVTRTLYTRKNRSNGLQKRFGDIKRTPRREVSNFYRSFSKENRNSRRSKLKSRQALISTSSSSLWLPGDYRWLWHFEPEHAALVDWGRREYMFHYLLSTIVLDLMEFPDDRCNGWRLLMSKLSSELRLTLTCHV